MKRLFGIDRLDFTHIMYSNLCEAMKLYNIVTVEKFLSEKTVPPFVLLRHDVDRDPDKALKVAKLENKCGIYSTYYFRYPYTYNLNVMSEICEMGHEIGYHYEVLDKAKGDYKAALSIFKEELKEFRRHFPVKTVCMHGNPLTRWDGRKLWDYYDYQDFGLIGEAFRSCTAVSVYLTDTGGNWNSSKNIKDKIITPNHNTHFIKKTPEVIQFLKNRTATKVYITTHPERWSKNIWEWAKSHFRDYFFNAGKLALQLTNKFK